MTQQKPVLAALDTGNDHSKGAVWDGDNIRCVKFKSRVIEGVPGLSMVGGSAARSPIFEFNGSALTVSESALNPLDMRKEGQTSPTAKALALATLLELGLEGHEVIAGMNLPLGDFVIRQPNGILTQNHALIDSKREALKHSSTDACLSGHKIPMIVKGMVHAEGYGAYADSVVSNTGEVNEPAGKMRGFIDIGGGTTEIGIVGQGFVLQPNFITLQIGTNTVADMLEERIKQRWPRYNSIERTLLDIAIETGKFVDYSGTEHDLTDDVEYCKSEVARKILQEAKTRLKDNLSILDMILLVGGGSLLLGKYFEDWDLISIPEDPEFSNVKGLLKILTFLTGLDPADYTRDVKQAPAPVAPSQEHTPEEEV